ncbi:CpsB/CapC family capsule biosynthesis tyrosine phosphatase [Piscinibacter sakaiensis]|uniref:protein-tyrosine-phosphatase n=1 Tax=Piscinibacter sakaiensis TaxID=1547922 RepID=A0A0K8NZA4_PISS1|nr:CpsB/CapC family capsule biosynthesis tyrosine phosphatase [Piscinibacter sakaiensis]GAP35634.1 manganese-dependent protein-tyrosine phosphatase [Piscinibacter sakaiensis]
MIDLHAHLLPGIDDGPATVEEALVLAKACAETGVNELFVTPHVYPGQWGNTRSSIAREFARFDFAVKRLGLPITLHMAGEVRLCDDIFELLGEGELPFLGRCQGFDSLLLELPDGQVPVGAERAVRHLLDHKVRPIIVHPERNKGVMERPERMRGFVEMGCVLQLTAASVVGEFGAAALRTAQTLIDEGWVDVVASDAHNLRGRAPRMDAARAALGKAYGPAFADELTMHGPARLAGLPRRQSMAA